MAHPTERARPERRAPGAPHAPAPSAARLPDGPGIVPGTPLTPAQVLHLQRTRGNRAVGALLGRAGAPHAGAVQRSLAKTGAGRLAKHGRFDFANDLKDAMPLNGGQHRAHTISYGLIARGVADTINLAISNHWDTDYLGYLDGLVDAVFPNGAAAGLWPGDQDLEDVAKKYHAAAKLAADQVQIWMQAQNLDEVLGWANSLVHALNNSPDNLRPGSGSTNSSIQEGLDLAPDTGKAGQLPIGTEIVDSTGSTARTLTAPLSVIRVADAHEAQVVTLLTRTYSQANELHLYSSGRKLQSSDYASMTSGSMTGAHPTHVAIEWGSGTGKFFLFAF